MASSGREQNLSQDTGQFDDMIASRSDDGTMPPTAESEAITTGKRPDHTIFDTKPNLIPAVRDIDAIDPRERSRLASRQEPLPENR